MSHNQHDHEPHAGDDHQQDEHNACHDDPVMRRADPARGGVHQSTRPSALVVELRAHVPFSVTAVAIGLIVAGAICIIGLSGTRGAGWNEGVSPAHGRSVGTSPVTSEGHDHVDDRDEAHSPARLFFHLFHPAHMLFSATATAAMFFRYDRRRLKAIIIGLIGAVGVCGVSDVVMPQISLMILGIHAPWHICVWEHPGLVLPFAFVGVLVGISASASVMHGTIVSHSLHVFASTMASIFYMVEPLGGTAWIDIIGKMFIFIVLAVMVPCCLSDIVFPMLMTRAGRDEFEREPHAH